MTDTMGVTIGGSATADQISALDIIEQVLQQYDLGSLAQWAWNEITQGASSDQVMLDMYQTPQFKQRFQGIFLRQAAGLPAISPADYVSYENTLAQMESQYGLPQGFLTDPTRVAQLIGGDVSTAEIQQRVESGYQAVAYAPDSVRQAFSAYFGVNGDGALASYFLDEKNALPLLTQQATAAQIGGAAYAGGINVKQQTAMELAGLGFTATGLGSTIQDLEQKAPLFEASINEKQGLTAGDQGIEAATGLSETATQDVIQRQEAREAEFAGAANPAEMTNYGAAGAGAARPV